MLFEKRSIDGEMHQENREKKTDHGKSNGQQKKSRECIFFKKKGEKRRDERWLF